MITPIYFKVPRRNHNYVTFIFEAYDGLATVSTVDIPAGIIRITPAAGRERETADLLAALREEIEMECITEL
ncbi:MAG: DUF4911 domain-containing protein [Trichlorobacter sp.]|nr:DUF4911 domain-containing protein [Trichlorobacter sp.]